MDQPDFTHRLGVLLVKKTFINCPVAAICLAVLLILPSPGMAERRSSPGAAAAAPSAPLRHTPEKAPKKSVSAEKWSQMAAELLRIKELRNPKLALECADKALSINPSYPPAYLNRGSAYMMLGQPEKALADFDQTVKLNPGLSQAYFNRALACEALGRYRDATDNYTVVIESNPNDAEAYVRRGAAFFDLLEDAQACKDLEKACQLGLCAPLEQARENQLCPKNNH